MTPTPRNPLQPQQPQQPLGNPNNPFNRISRRSIRRSRRSRVGMDSSGNTVQRMAEVWETEEEDKLTGDLISVIAVVETPAGPTAAAPSTTPQIQYNGRLWRPVTNNRRSQRARAVVGNIVDDRDDEWENEEEDANLEEVLSGLAVFGISREPSVTEPAVTGSGSVDIRSADIGQTASQPTFALPTGTLPTGTGTRATEPTFIRPTDLGLAATEQPTSCAQRVENDVPTACEVKHWSTFLDKIDPLELRRYNQRRENQDFRGENIYQWHWEYAPSWNLDLVPGSMRYYSEPHAAQMMDDYLTGNPDEVERRRPARDRRRAMAEWLEEDWRRSQNTPAIVQTVRNPFQPHREFFPAETASGGSQSSSSDDGLHDVEEGDEDDDEEYEEEDLDSLPPLYDSQEEDDAPPLQSMSSSDEDDQYGFGGENDDQWNNIPELLPLSSDEDQRGAIGGTWQPVNSGFDTENEDNNTSQLPLNQLTPPSAAFGGFTTPVGTRPPLHPVRRPMEGARQPVTDPRSARRLVFNRDDQQTENDNNNTSELPLTQLTSPSSATGGLRTPQGTSPPDPPVRRRIEGSRQPVTEPRSARRLVFNRDDQQLVRGLFEGTENDNNNTSELPLTQLTSPSSATGGLRTPQGTSPPDPPVRRRIEGSRQPVTEPRSSRRLVFNRDDQQTENDNNNTSELPLTQFTSPSIATGRFRTPQGTSPPDLPVRRRIEGSRQPVTEPRSARRLAFNRDDQQSANAPGTTSNAVGGSPNVSTSAPTTPHTAQPSMSPASFGYGNPGLRRPQQPASNARRNPSIPNYRGRLVSSSDEDSSPNYQPSAFGYNTPVTSRVTTQNDSRIGNNPGLLSFSSDEDQAFDHPVSTTRRTQSLNQYPASSNTGRSSRFYSERW